MTELVKVPVYAMTGVEGNIVGYIHELADAPSDDVLGVPWVSQLGPGAAFAPGDCGPAAVTMILHYYGLVSLTVDDISKQTGQAQGFRYTGAATLMRIMRGYGFDTYWKRYLDLDDLRAEIDADHPCIVLVQYNRLPSRVRYDSGYKFGHWPLVVGYTETGIVYHDSYFPSTAGGAFVEITNDEFDLAWKSTPESGNSPRQAIRRVR